MNEFGRARQCKRILAGHANVEITCNRYIFEGVIDDTLQRKGRKLLTRKGGQLGKAVRLP